MTRAAPLLQAVTIIVFLAAPAVASAVAYAPQYSPQPTANPCPGGKGHIANTADIAGGAPPRSMVCDSDRALISDPGTAKQDLAANFLEGAALSRGSQDVEGMVPIVACRLDTFLNAARAQGHDIRINSGARPVEVQQAEMIKASSRGQPGMACGNGRLPVEECPHVAGRAADLTFDGVARISATECARSRACTWAHQYARQYQLDFPLNGSGTPLEPWHIEPIERETVDKTAQCNGAPTPQLPQIREAGTTQAPSLLTGVVYDQTYGALGTTLYAQQYAQYTAKYAQYAQDYYAYYGLQAPPQQPPYQPAQPTLVTMLQQYSAPQYQTQASWGSQQTVDYHSPPPQDSMGNFAPNRVTSYSPAAAGGERAAFSPYSLAPAAQSAPVWQIDVSLFFQRLFNWNPQA